MHPRERRTTRRRFVAQSGGALLALLGGDALWQAAAALGGGAPMGPGGIPLARRNAPVTLPLSTRWRAIRLYLVFGSIWNSPVVAAGACARTEKAIAAVAKPESSFLIGSLSVFSGAGPFATPGRWLPIASSYTPIRDFHLAETATNTHL